MKPPPSIRVESIPEEGLTLTLALEPAWLTSILADAEMRPAEGTHASARLRLDTNEREVIVSGDIACTIVAQCVACLEDANFVIASNFHLILEPEASKPKSSRPTETELSPGELDTDTYSDDTIDLSHWLREQILLEAPVHPRHEGDCPHPLTLANTTNGGAARTIDPRLAPLLTLARKE